MIWKGLGAPLRCVCRPTGICRSANETPLPPADILSYYILDSLIVAPNRINYLSVNFPEVSIFMRSISHILSGISLSPEERYQCRKNFYLNYGYGRNTRYGYGFSEMAFLRWQIARGVHNADTCGEKPGSPWWRAIHNSYIFYSESAALLYKNDRGAVSTNVPIQMWLEYFRNPGSSSWYKAHNSSIIRSYFHSRNEAYKESAPEKIFINIVLFRLLYAQAMAENNTILRKFGKWFADPENFSIKWLINIPRYYPRIYPIAGKSITACQNSVNESIMFHVKNIDKIFILPRLSWIYEFAAKINNTPDLLKFINGNNPIYPDIL